MDLTLLKDYAFRFVGTPYLYGGKTPMSGEDCSGLVTEVLRFGGLIKYDQVLNAQGIHDFLLTLPGTKELMAPDIGAVAFYGQSDKAITHTAFCIDYFRAIGADGGHEDTLNIETAVSEHAYVKGLPVKYRIDLVKMLLPKYP